jgi:acetyl-CoA carboxylase biotin carboxyl carrier protein
MGENTAIAEAKEKEPMGTKTGRRGKAAARSAEASFNMAEIRELADLVDEHGFTDFEFENENIRVRLSKMTSAPVSYAAAPPAPATAPPIAPPEPQPEPADPDAGLHKITSPIVGTFYRSPGPDKDPYVKEGAKVSPETVVCIVEAMKLMNEIQAETTGEIVRIYVENGQPVEFGQALFGIRQ